MVADSKGIDLVAQDVIAISIQEDRDPRRDPVRGAGDGPVVHRQGPILVFPELVLKAFFLGPLGELFW